MVGKVMNGGLTQGRSQSKQSGRSQSRQSSRSSLSMYTNDKSVDFALQTGEWSATWYYDADMVGDGVSTVRGRAFIEQEQNQIEEVILFIQNGILHVQRTTGSVSKNTSRTSSIALQDANVTPKDKTDNNNYFGLQIMLPGREQQLTLYLETVEERDEWISALKFNSLGHTRQQVDELRWIQTQTQTDLHDAQKKVDEATQQIQDLKHRLTTQKSALEIEKTGLVESYEKMQGKQEATNFALIQARQELEAAMKELNTMKQATQQKISDASRQWNEEMKRTRSVHDAKIEQISMEISEKDGLLKSLSGDLEQAHQEMHQLDQTRASMNRDLRTFKQKCGELQRQLDDTINKLRVCEEKREQLQHRLIVAQEANEMTQQKLQLITQESKEAKAEKDALEMEVSARKNELSTIKLQSHELEGQVANLKGQIQVQQHESQKYVESLKETIKAKDAELQLIHRANVEVEAKHEVLKQEVRDKSSKLRSLQKSLASTQEVNRKLSDEMKEGKEIKRRLKQTETELDDQKQKKTDANKRNAILTLQNMELFKYKEAAESARIRVLDLEDQMKDYQIIATALVEAKQRIDVLLNRIVFLEQEVPMTDHCTQTSDIFIDDSKSDITSFDGVDFNQCWKLKVVGGACLGKPEARQTFRRNPLKFITRRR